MLSSLVLASLFLTTSGVFDHHDPTAASSFCRRWIHRERHKSSVCHMSICAAQSPQRSKAFHRCESSVGAVSGCQSKLFWSLTHSSLAFGALGSARRTRLGRALILKTSYNAYWFDSKLTAGIFFPCYLKKPHYALRQEWWTGWSCNYDLHHDAFLAQQNYRGHFVC